MVDEWASAHTVGRCPLYRRHQNCTRPDRWRSRSGRIPNATTALGLVIPTLWSNASWPPVPAAMSSMWVAAPALLLGSFSPPAAGCWESSRTRGWPTSRTSAASTSRGPPSRRGVPPVVRLMRSLPHRAGTGSTPPLARPRLRRCCDPRGDSPYFARCTLACHALRGRLHGFAHEGQRGNATGRRVRRS